jgi:hypothetical protein
MTFFCGSVFGQQVQKTMFIFLQSRSLAETLATSRGSLRFRGTPVEKPWSTHTKYLNLVSPENKFRALQLNKLSRQAYLCYPNLLQVGLGTLAASCSPVL